MVQGRMLLLSRRHARIDAFEGASGILAGLPDGVSKSCGVRERWFPLAKRLFGGRLTPREETEVTNGAFVGDAGLIQVGNDRVSPREIP